MFWIFTNFVSTIIEEILLSYILGKNIINYDFLVLVARTTLCFVANCIFPVIPLVTYSEDLLLYFLPIYYHVIIYNILVYSKIPFWLVILVYKPDLCKICCLLLDISLINQATNINFRSEISEKYSGNKFTNCNLIAGQW